MDSDWVADQTRLYLIEPLRLYLAEQGQPAYVSGDSFVYYLPAPGRKVRRLGPDFYVVMGGQSQGQTKWVSWEEGGLLPTTVIEFVSPSTESRDRGQKFCTYRDVFQTEDYFIVKPETLKVEGFHLSHGHYVALQGQPDGWFWVNSLGLWLGPLDGWLRLRTPDGQLLATGRELAEQERQRAEQERQRADQQRQRAEQAEARLSQLEEQLRRLQGP
jgi:Uma2 family endonuclease